MLTLTRPGAYTYLDAIGGPPQIVMVDRIDGELVAVFPAIDGEERGEVPVADMSGEFEQIR